jgi:hypothetical protein
MKTKVLLFATAVLFAAGVALHSGHEPKDGKCPLKTAMTAKK